MARLPQMVKQKTGLAEGTIDDEFKELNLTYVRIKQDTTKFLNECISYKAAMLSKYTHKTKLETPFIPLFRFVEFSGFFNGRTSVAFN